MPALQRNLVPILVGVAAVLVSLASVALIVESMSNDDNRVFAGDFFTEVEPGELRFQIPFPGVFLGVTVDTDGGALLVQRVQPGSTADLAGVREGDVILRAAGQDVNSVAALREVLRGLRPGERYDLDVRRDDTEHRLQATHPYQVENPFAFPPPARDGEPYDAFLESLADEVEQRLRERGVVPPTASPPSGP